jgi:hypothetical protein
LPEGTQEREAVVCGEQYGTALSCVRRDKGFDLRHAIEVDGRERFVEDPQACGAQKKSRQGDSSALSR